LKRNPLDLSSFSALTLLVGSLTHKTVPDMTYNVFGGTLNLIQSLSLWWWQTSVNIICFDN